MARKLPGLQRVLDAPALFSVAYGEIASSIYFALGIIALHALGLTPRGAARRRRCSSCSSRSRTPRARPRFRETGGAATFVRRAFNDLAGFMTGWVLFLDYLIVIALAALFMPHYLGGARSTWTSLEHNPWDVVVGVARDRRHRGDRGSCAAPRFYRSGSSSRCSTSRRSSCSSCSASRSSSRRDALTHGTSRSARTRAGTRSPSRCRSRCSPTPGSRPSRTSPRRRAARARPAAQPLRRDRARRRALRRDRASSALSAFPATGGTTALGTDWLRAPLVGIVDALARHRCPTGLGDGAALLRRPHRRADPARRGRRRRSPASRGSPTRSASTGSCRARSAGCTGARSSRRRRSSRAALISIALLIGTSLRQATTSPSSRASSASACCSRSRPRSSR